MYTVGIDFASTEDATLYYGVLPKLTPPGLTPAKAEVHGATLVLTFASSRVGTAFADHLVRLGRAVRVITP